jgi:hypothetical protein
MRKLAMVFLGCAVLCAGVPVPTHAQKKEPLIEREKRQGKVERKQARKAEEAEERKETLRGKIDKVRKYRALAVERGEETDLDEVIENLRHEADKLDE